MIDLHELYWTAGFLEGEGYFHAHKQKNRKWYQLLVRCFQNQKEPLEHLQKLFGGKIYPRNNGFEWYLWGVNCSGLMMTLWSLMSSKRKQQIEGALIKWKSNRNKSEAALNRECL